MIDNGRITVFLKWKFVVWAAF